MTISEPTPAPEYATLYRRAFEEFGMAALWRSKPVPGPTPADALAITYSLRVEGNAMASTRPADYTVLAQRGGETTKLEWVDSDFRFFPTIRDETFGYVLYPVDLPPTR